MDAQTKGALRAHVETISMLDTTLFPEGAVPEKMLARTKQYIGAARTSQQYVLKYEVLKP
eukprot:1356338-Pyramimonas_sp.AAC.1